MHLESEAVWSFEIWAGHVDVRTGQLAFVNLTLEIQVGVSFDAPSCAHRGYACGQIQPWSRKCHLRNQQRLLPTPISSEIGARDIKEVIVHAHDARHHRVSAEVEDRHALCGRNVRAGFDRSNLSVLNHDVLILLRSSASPVDDANVLENNFGRVHTDIILY